MLRVLAAILLIAGCTSPMHAAFEVIRIAKSGAEVDARHAERRDWPANALDLVNLPQRTDGWQSAFSGLRIETEEYEFSPRSEEDVQRIIDAFARIDSAKKVIQLSPLREPSAIGMAPVRRNVLKMLERRDKPFNGPFVTVFGGKGTAAVLVMPNEFRRTKEEEAQIRKALPHRVGVRHPLLILFVQNQHVNLQRLRFPPKVNLQQVVSGPAVQSQRKTAIVIDRVVRDYQADLRNHADVVSAWGKPDQSLQAGIRCRRELLKVRGRVSTVVEIVLRNVGDKAIQIPAAPALMKSRETGRFSYPGTDDLKVLAGKPQANPDEDHDEVLTQVRESFAAAEEEFGPEFGIKYNIAESTLTGYYLAWDVLTRNRELAAGEILVVGKMFVEYERPLSGKLVAGPDNVEPFRRQGTFQVGCEIPIHGHHQAPLRSGYLDFDVGR